MVTFLFLFFLSFAPRMVSDLRSMQMEQQRRMQELWRQEQWSKHMRHSISEQNFLQHQQHQAQLTKHFVKFMKKKKRGRRRKDVNILDEIII